MKDIHLTLGIDIKGRVMMMERNEEGEVDIANIIIDVIQMIFYLNARHLIKADHHIKKVHLDHAY